MDAHLDVRTIIDALQDPILILAPKRGRIVAYNEAFVREWGSEELTEGRAFVRMPCFSRSAQRGLIGLYVEARRGRADVASFSFACPGKDGALKTIVATARPIGDDEDGHHVMLRFDAISSLDAAAVETQDLSMAFEAFSEITGECWAEFRPSIPIVVPAFGDDDRQRRIELIGRRLRLSRANKTALHFYGLSDDEASSPEAAARLEQRTFPSFFYHQEDAHRILDILTVTGSIKTKTILMDNSGRTFETDISCSVRFGGAPGDMDTIEAIWCVVHTSEALIDLRDAFAKSQQERDILFAQPFLGMGEFVPRWPLGRPGAQDVDDEIDRALDALVLSRANGAFLQHCGAQKEQLLMQPMTVLFHDRDTAAYVLKELFVMRESSFAKAVDAGGAEQVLLFKAMFNGAGQLARVLVVSSLHADGFEARYDDRRSRPGPAQEM